MVPDEKSYWEEALDSFYKNDENAFTSKGFPATNEYILVKYTPLWVFKGYCVNKRGQKGSDVTVHYDPRTKKWGPKQDPVFKKLKDTWRKARYVDKARTY